MATILSCVGKSGQNFDFETFPVGTQFNHVSGVYIGCVARLGGMLEALYVGEAKSLHDRVNAGFADHDGLQRALRHGMTHIAVRLVSDEAERLRIETDLRHGLNPVCNRQPVPSNALSLADVLRYTKQ